MMSGKCESGSCSSHKWCGVVVRLLIAAIFLYAGYGKITNIEGTAAYIASAGLPWTVGLAWMAAILELVGGVLIVIGCWKRYAALVLVLFTMAATYLFHFKAAIAGDATQWVQVLKNLAIIGALSLLSGCGKCGGCGCGSCDTGKCGVCGGPAKEGEMKCEMCKNK